VLFNLFIAATYFVKPNSI